MEGAHDVRRGTAAGDGRSDAREPVIVGMMRVDDVHPLRAHELRQAPHVRERRERCHAGVEREPVDQVEPGLARLGFEAIARHHPESYRVSARPQSGDQPDHGIGAARPPAVGREVDDRQGIAAHARAVIAVDSCTAVRTRPASIDVMHGCSIGQVR